MLPGRHGVPVFDVAEGLEHGRIVGRQLEGASGTLARRLRQPVHEAARGAVPESSVFPTLELAQRFLVELYTAFRPSADGKSVNSVDIKRGAWNVRMVGAPRARFDLMDGSALFPAGSTQLDSVIYVEDIEYYWHTVKRLEL